MVCFTPVTGLNAQVRSSWYQVCPRQNVKRVATGTEKLRACAGPVGTNKPNASHLSESEGIPTGNSPSFQASSEPVLTKSEKMLALLGRDVEAEKAYLAAKAAEISAEVAAEKKRNTSVAILSAILGVAVSLLTHIVHADPLQLLQRMENLSSQATVIGNGRPTLLEVYAPWCTTCKSMASALYDLELSPLGLSVNFITLNADNPEIASLLDRFQVEGVPHFALLDKTGNLKGTFVGYVPVKFLEDDLNALTNGYEELPHPGVDFSQIDQGS